MQSSFIDSRMLTVLQANHFPQTCTIRAATSGTDSFGQPEDTWADVAGQTDIPCSVALAGGRVVQEKQLEYGMTTHRISLAGQYLGISRLNRAVVGGVTYQVQYVNTSGFDNSVTVLECNVCDVGGA